MPYKSKRSYRKRGRSYGRKRRTTKKKGKQGKSKRLLKKRPGSKRSGARSVQVAKTLDVTDRIRQASTYDVSYLNTFTCYPEITGKDGAFIQSFWASCPSNVMYPDATPVPNDYNTGDKMPASGNGAADFDGANFQCTIPQQFWNHVEVTSADIEIVATPIPPAADPDATDIYQPRSMLWLTLTKDWNPWQSAAGMGNVLSNSVIQNGKYTVTAVSELLQGSRSQSVILKGSYVPRKLFMLKDIADRPGNFQASLGNSVGAVAPGMMPNSFAGWNFGIVTAAPTALNLVPPPVTFVRGIPAPHIVQVKINYRTKWSNPAAGELLNFPL